MARPTGEAGQGEKNSPGPRESGSEKSSEVAVKLKE